MNNGDIVIVGGGLIGLACACLFAREGFQTIVADAGQPPVWDPSRIPDRVSALNLSTRHLLEHVGVWDTIQTKRHTPFQTMRVWDSHSQARIEFHAMEEGAQALGYIVENALVTTSMLEFLRHNYHVQLRYGTRITGLNPGSSAGDDSVRLQFENEEIIDGSLVVAADGAQSTIRAMAGIELSRQDFHQDAVVATLEATRWHQQTAYQVFTPEGPIAMLPLDDQRCSLVWSRDRRNSDELVSMEPDEFCRCLEQHFGPHLGALRLTGPRLRFPLSSQQATCYHGHRLALVGDAAHTVHPLAGLGANLGMLDAAALVEIVTSAKNAGKNIGGRSVLRRYERWRRGENGVAIQVMKGFKELFGSASPTVRLSRAAAFRIADGVLPLKHLLARYAMGTRGDLPAACLPDSAADSV